MRADPACRCVARPGSIDALMGRKLTLPAAITVVVLSACGDSSSPPPADASMDGGMQDSAVADASSSDARPDCGIGDYNPDTMMCDLPI